MIDPESWRRIEGVLDELLELTPEERQRRLAALDGDDATLRPAIERLLAADSETRAGVLDRGLGPLAGGVLDADEPPAHADRRIGPYRVIRSLGRGGMGEVYLAERAEGDFEQHVALKIVRGGPRQAEIIERFRRERRILARLRHPHIAALYDGGATEDGVPWFAMEYVAGEPITDYCDARRLGVHERVQLFEAVCRAVQYAHRNLVVHRDIKPSNVFVTADGTVKLLDFGVGKLLDAESADETQPMRAFMTPAFAAPEQIRGEATSTASDIFSLGMLLYVLLTGHHPYGDTSRSVEVARAIVEKDPPDPSALVLRDSTTLSAAEIARRRGVEPAELRRRLRGDLDNILARALRKHPEERYASAQDLRDDLERYRTSLPVEARASTAGYRFRKFVRRHRVGTTAGAVTLLAVLSGIGGVLWQARVADRERDRAQAVKEYLIDVFSAVDPSYESGETLRAVELVERGAARIAERFGEDPAVRAEITSVLGTVLTSLARYERADQVLSAALDEHRRLGDTEGVHETLLRLGESAQWQGRLDAALAYFEEARALGDRAFGEDDPRSIRAAFATASALQELGRVDASGALHREALERARRVFGEGTAEVALHHVGLANHLVAVGDFEAAEREMRTAVDAYRTSSAGGVELSEALSGLGMMLEVNDAREESEAVMREAVDVLRREYADEGHPRLALALTNLAGPLMRSSLAETAGADRLAEAERYLREAHEMLERTVGEESWLLGQSFSNLSVVRTKQGDIEGAEPLLREAVRITRATVGDRHAALGAPLSNLARNLLRQKRYEESAEVYEEAITLSRDVFGARDVRVSHPVLGLADLHLETGRLEEAVRAATEGWEIRRDGLGASHSLTVEARVQLGVALAAAGLVDESVAMLDGAIADGRSGLPDTRPVLASALLARARRAREAGEPPGAVEPLLAEALEIREDAYGADDERTREVRDELAGSAAGSGSNGTGPVPAGDGDATRSTAGDDRP